MTDFNTVFDLYAKGAIAESKKSNVAAVAEEKKTRLDPYQLATALTKDPSLISDEQVIETDPIAYRLAYGSQKAADHFTALSDAGSRLYNDQSIDRSLPEIASDSALSFGSGFVNTLGGVGVLGAAGSDALLGTNMASPAVDILNKFNENVNSLKSASLQGNTRAVHALQEAMSQNADREYLAKLDNGENTTVVKLERIGKGVLNAVNSGTSNSDYLGSLVAEGVGSIAAIPPLSAGTAAIAQGFKGVGKATASLVEKNIAKGMTKEAAELAAKESITNIRNAAATTNIGLTEAGGAYQQASTEAAEILAKRTDLTDQQKAELRNRAGLLAAAITFPAAIAAGKLVAPFEAAPFAPKTLKNLSRQMGFETTEEGIQNALGHTASNIGISGSGVDPTKEWHEGVGEAMGEGVLAGGLSAGVIGAPGVVRHTTATLAAKGAELTKPNQQDLNTTVENTASVIQEKIDSQTEDDSPEVKEKLQGMLDTVRRSQKFTANHLDNTSEEFKQKISSIESTEEAIDSLAEHLNNLQEGKKILDNDPDTVAAAKNLLDIVSQFRDNMESLNQVNIDEVDSDVVGSMNTLGQKLDELVRKPGVAQALSNLYEEIEEVSKNINNVSPEQVNNVTDMIVANPDNVSDEAINNIRTHIIDNFGNEDPRVKLLSLAQEARNILRSLVGSSDNEPLNKVTNDILNNPDLSESFTSLKEHYNNIKKALQTGEGFDIAITNLSNFITSQKNKRDALLESKANFESGLKGNANLDKHYQMWSPTLGKFMLSPKPVFYTGKKSEELGRRISNEIKTLEKLYNWGTGDTSVSDVTTAPVKETKATTELVTQQEKEVDSSNTEVKDSVKEDTSSNLDQQRATDEEVSIKAKNEPKEQESSEITSKEEEVKQEESIPESNTEEIGKLARRETIRNLKTKSNKLNYVLDLVDKFLDINPEFEFDIDTKGNVKDILAKLLPQMMQYATSKDSGLKNRFKNLMDSIFNAAGKEGNETLKSILTSIKANKGNSLNVFEQALTNSKLQTQLKKIKVGPTSLLEKVGEAILRLLGIKTKQESAMAHIYDMFEEMSGISYEDEISLVQLQQNSVAGLNFSKYIDTSVVKAKNIANMLYNALDKNKISEESFNLIEKLNEVFSTKIQENVNKQIKSHRLPPQRIEELHNLRLLTFFTKDPNAPYATKDNITLDPYIKDALITSFGIWFQSGQNQMMTTGDVVRFYRDLHGVNISQSRAEELLDIFPDKFTAYASVRAVERIFKEATGLRSPKGATLYEEGVIRSLIASAFEVLSNDDGTGLVLKYKYTGKNTGRSINLYSINPSFKMKVSTEILDTLKLDGDFEVYNELTEPPKVNNKVLHSDRDITKKQKSAINNMNQQVYNLVGHVANVFTLLGKDRVDILFGSTYGEKFLSDNAELFNQEHLGRLRSKLKTTDNAFELLERLKEGIDYYFNNRVTSVNRAQQVGNAVPQSNKVVRAFLSPNKAIIDLTSTEGRNLFNTAIAQAFGEKVDINNQEQINEFVEELKAKGIDEVATELIEAKDISDDLFEKIKPFLTNDPVSLQALVEYGRSLKADQTEFETNLYIEADGKTNGPGWAIINMNTYVDEEWITNANRVGFNFGSELKSIDELYNNGKEKLKDIYTAAMEAVNKQFMDIPPNSLIRDILMDLASTDKKEGLLLDALKYDEVKKTFTISRSVIKDIIIKITYGAGNKAISVALTDLLINTVYNKTSEYNLLKNKTNRTKEENEQLKKLHDYIEIASSKGFFPGLNKNLVGYEVKEFHRENFIKIFNDEISPYIRAGVEEVTGHAAAFNVKKIIDASQIAATVARVVLNKLLTDLKAKYPGSNKLIKSITRQDLKDIKDKLNKLFPNIPLDDNAVIGLLANESDIISSNIFSEDNVVQSIQGSVSIGIEGPAVGNPSVSHVPSTSISMADAVPVLNAFSQGDGLVDAIQVFDGINMSLDLAQEQSRIINNNVADTWLNNIFEGYKDVLLNIKDILNDVDLTIEDVNQYNQDSFRFEYKETGEPVDPSNPPFKSVDEFVKHINNMINIFNNLSNFSKAREKVLKELGFSVDQYTSLKAPGQIKGTGGVTITAEEIQEKINEELSKDSKKEEESESNGYDILTKLRDSNKISLNQKLIIKLLLSDKFKDKVSKVIVRKVGQIKFNNIVNTSTSDSLKESNATGKLQGFFYIDDKKNKYIVVRNNAEDLIETTLHELLHSVFTEAVSNAIDNIKQIGNKRLPKEVRDKLFETKRAIDVLEVYAQEILNGKYDSKGMLNLKNQLKKLVDESSFEDNKKVILDEFVAWSLSNKEIMRTVKLWDSIKRTIAKIFNLNSSKSFANALEEITWAATVIATNNDKPINPNKKRDNTKIRYHSTTSNSLVDGVMDKVSAVLKSDSNFQSLLKFHKANSKNNINKQSRYESFFNHTMFFKDDPAAKTAFTLLVDTLTIWSKANPSALNEVHKIYTKFINNISEQDYQDDTGKQYEKYNTILGKNNSGIPTPILFLALASLDKRTRDLLENISSDSSTELNKGSANELLDSIADKAFEYINKNLYKKGKGTNLLESFESLADSVIEEEKDSSFILNTVGQAVHSSINVIDVGMANAMHRVGDVALDIVTSDDKTTLQKALALPATLLSKNGAKMVGDMLTSFGNNSHVPDTIRALFRDIAPSDKWSGRLSTYLKAIKNNFQSGRQQILNQVPLMIAKAFKGKLTDKQWTSITNTFIKTDSSSFGSFSTFIEALDSSNRAKLIRDTLATISGDYTADHSEKSLIEEARRTAKFMVTGEGSYMLRRNEVAIDTFLFKPEDTAKNNERQNLIRQLVSLYALEELSKEDIKEISNLLKEEESGLEVVYGFTYGAAKQEFENMNINSMRGYIPTLLEDGSDIAVASKDNENEYIAKGYKVLAPYSSTENYYYAPVTGKGKFLQGALQTIRITAGGVDVVSGYARGFKTAGIITNEDKVRQYLSHELVNDNLIPIYDASGNVIALEKLINPEVLKEININTNAANILAKMLARLEEEKGAHTINEELIKMMYSEYSSNKSRKSEYINILDPKQLTRTQQDAVSLVPNSYKRLAQKSFGKGIWMVRRDEFDIVFGHREAGIGDFLSGISNWDPKTQKAIREGIETMFGKEAFSYLLKGEDYWRTTIQEAKVLIVVKSLVVPAANAFFNIVQLVANGVPITDIVKGIKEYTNEANILTKSLKREAELKALLVGTIDRDKLNKIRAELNSLLASREALKIYPLYLRGEFGSIQDVGNANDISELTGGNLRTLIDEKVSKLPQEAKTLLHYGFLTKDTSLYQLLQRSVEYGDFVAKAIFEDHLRNTTKLSKDEIVNAVREEFVDYDLPAGRNRQWAGSMGLEWFWNYKLRITKTAYRMLLNHPFRSLMVSLNSSMVETPLTENIFTKFFGGSLGATLGPGLLFRAPELHPVGAVLL